ncbi:MAG: GNAT family N-acetyltransferase, partial [Chitinophagaceae bacterium]
PGTLRNPSGKWGYVLNVYTAPDYRRKGFSKQVLELLMQTATDEYEVMAFELHATAEGEQVYVKSGFATHPEPTFRRFVNG